VKITLVCVGRPRGPVADVIAVYEKRIPHYFGYEAVEVRETPGRGRSASQVSAEEGERILARVPGQGKVIALHRLGPAWSSERLATWLGEVASHGFPGVSFVIGGAFGLSPAVLDRADESISLSAMTFPHEVARLMLAEQLYRSGTILRGEPYHKGKGT
jgi:23S rRNA (pseudouridine1915-N3)-methyltransferase